MSCRPPVKENINPLQGISEQYIRLALEIGQWDPDFVDAYYGPEEFKPDPVEADSAEAPFEELKWIATELLNQMEELNIDKLDSMEVLRYRFLLNQLVAVKTKLELISGEVIPFDVESRSLYDAVTPHYSEDHYIDLVKKLDELLPGDGTLVTRYHDFMEEFTIPPDRLDTVFRLAIAEARERTARYIEIPEGESLTFEYVTNKPWIGYNRYKGNGRSIIQVNMDFPMTIDKAMYLACHDGYPGHHLYNAKLEQALVLGRGWEEFTIYPLFSPQSLIAEGSANFGMDLAFPGSDRQEFERQYLFPLAKLDTIKVDLFYEVLAIKIALSYADNEVAKRYLDGQIGQEEAAEWLVNYTLRTRDEAMQRLEYYEKYRSYVINFNFGYDLIKQYVYREAGDDIEGQWSAFERILTTPVTASMIE